MQIHGSMKGAKYQPKTAEKKIYSLTPKLNFKKKDILLSEFMNASSSVSIKKGNQIRKIILLC